MSLKSKKKKKKDKSDKGGRRGEERRERREGARRLDTNRQSAPEPSLMHAHKQRLAHAYTRTRALVHTHAHPRGWGAPRRRCGLPAPPGAVGAPLRGPLRPRTGTPRRGAPGIPSGAGNGGSSLCGAIKGAPLRPPRGCGRAAPRRSAVSPDSLLHPAASPRSGEPFLRSPSPGCGFSAAVSVPRSPPQCPALRAPQAPPRVPPPPCSAPGPPARTAIPPAHGHGWIKSESPAAHRGATASGRLGVASCRS